MGNAHRGTRGHGSRQERAGIRQIGFHGDLEAGERTGGNNPAVLATLGGVVLLHPHATFAERLNRHLNVRNRGNRGALVHEHEPLRQARSHEQKRRDELGRGRSVDAHDGSLVHRHGGQAQGTQNEG